MSTHNIFFHGEIRKISLILDGRNALTGAISRVQNYSEGGL